MAKKKKKKDSEQEEKTTDFESIKDKIKTVDEIPDHYSVLVWGRSGTGKTTFAATFPKPILLLDIREEGTDSIKDVEGVHVISIEEWDEIEQVYWFIKEEMEFKTVVIDTVTQMQQTGKEKVLLDEGKDPDDIMSRRLWGTLSGLMQTWIINYRNLPLNVVFIAQDRTTDEEVEEEQMVPEVGPRTMPSVASTLNAAVKVIGQAYIKEVTKSTKSGRIITKPEFRLRLGPHPIYTTKIRQPKEYYLPSSIPDPTFSKLDSIIKGNYKKSKSKKKKGGKS